MNEYAPWLVHSCGWRDKPSMGNQWFTAKEHGYVCPKCGGVMPANWLDNDYYGWRLVTARLVRIRDGFLRSHTELEEARDD